MKVAVKQILTAGNGDKELAIANYKKSLQMNPKNTNAVEALKKLDSTQN